MRCLFFFFYSVYKIYFIVYMIFWGKVICILFRYFWWKWIMYNIYEVVIFVGGKIIIVNILIYINNYGIYL